MKHRFIPPKASQSGFSLSGAMIALGVVSILGLIIANLSTTATRIFADIEKNNAVNETFTELRFTLANKKICTENFKNKSFNVDNANGLEIAEVASFSIKPTGTQKAGRIIAKNQLMNGLRVRDLRLAPVVGGKLSDALSLVELKATFTKDTAGKTSNSQSDFLVRSVPLLMRIQADRIQECWVRKPYAEMAYNTICSSTTKGALNSIATSSGTNSADQGHCTLANGKWFTGGSMSASCPSGSFLPDDSDSRFNCRPVIPKTFKDSFPKVSIPATSGQPFEQSRPSYVMTLDKKSKTCHCNWATDIPTGTISSFKCEILCLVPQ